MRIFRLIVVVVLLFIICLTMMIKGSPLPEIKVVAVHENAIEHPADIAFDNGQFWFAEVYSKHLLIKDQLSSDVRSFYKDSKQTRLRSPHFIETNQQGVFVSEGWGDGVSFFPFDESQPSKVAFPEKLRAPHGICIDKNNWLYVGDSLNSRVVRFHLSTQQFQVFKDNDQRIAYVRQILCRKDGVWLSNSYERREGLNIGQGANVLVIKEFESGEVETVVEFPDTNITGISVVEDKLLLVSRWLGHNDVAVFDLHKKQLAGSLDLDDARLGVPYGIKYYPKSKKLFVSFLGDIIKKNHKGGILQFKVL